MAASALAVLALTGSAFADQSYTDTTGEVAGSADISTVAVANNPSAGTITFTVTTNYTAAFDDNTLFGILADTDSNASTGLQGFDYLIGVGNNGAVVVNTSTLSGVPETQSSVSNGVWTITVPVTDVGSPTGAINFVAFTDIGPDPNNPIEDDAPDNGVWTYQMVQPPPPPPPPAPKPAPVTVTSVTLVTPGAPTHGKWWHAGLSVKLSSGSQAKATGLKCSATLGGKHFSSACSFKLPANAKGEKLSVKVTGKYKTKSLSKSASYTVK